MVEVVEAAVTFELRHQVLGRGRTPADLARPDDSDPDSGNFAIYQGDRVVATGAVRRHRSPNGGAEPQWRIRGMAVAPELRGRGLGSAVLAAIIDHVASRGGGHLWCHARIRAASLYQRAGFIPTDDPFEDPVAGTQRFMSLHVAPVP